jgi:hypothetical protein
MAQTVGQPILDEKKCNITALWIRRAEDNPNQLEELCIECSPTITVSRLKNLIVSAKLFRNVNFNSDIVSILHGGVALDARVVVIELPDLAADPIFVLALKDDKFSNSSSRPPIASLATTTASSTRTPISSSDKLASDSDATKANISVSTGGDSTKTDAKSETQAPAHGSMRIE